VQPLLEHIQRIEQLLGRVRTVPNGPRTIDIDILLCEQTIYQSETLTIPHPRYHERRFTLAPLAELSPSLRDPVTGLTMLEMLSALQGQVAKPTGAEPEQS
jgi:7,8-dihydro-6-hydroxymethylpterin-pyrophosphokinase